jgi:predicted AAA+ superfamily ATPase
LNRFENFLRVLAGRIGQIINLHSIANDIGVSGTTLQGWLSVLESSYIVFRLQPYYENIGKRAVKSPKLYFTDTGLAAYLLGINELSHVARDPLLGNLFENLVVLEALKSRKNRGADPDIYFFRDNHQNEIDLIFKKGRQLIPIEIKAAMTYDASLHSVISFFQKLTGSKEGYLIYGGDLEVKKETITAINYQQTYTIFDV